MASSPSNSDNSAPRFPLMPSDWRKPSARGAINITSITESIFLRVMEHHEYNWDSIIQEHGLTQGTRFSSFTAQLFKLPFMEKRAFEVEVDGFMIVGVKKALVWTRGEVLNIVKHEVTALLSTANDSRPAAILEWLNKYGVPITASDIAGDIPTIISNLKSDLFGTLANADPLWSGDLYFVLDHLLSLEGSSCHPKLNATEYWNRVDRSPLGRGIQFENKARIWTVDNTEDGKVYWYYGPKTAGSQRPPKSLELDFGPLDDEDLAFDQEEEGGEGGEAGEEGVEEGGVGGEDAGHAQNSEEASEEEEQEGGKVITPVKKVVDKATINSPPSLSKPSKRPPPSESDDDASPIASTKRAGKGQLDT